MNVGAFVTLWLTWRHRRIHRLRPLQHIWYIRNIRLGWLLDHASMSCNDGARFDTIQTTSSL
jgi:hypothetical protein